MQSPEIPKQTPKNIANQVVKTSDQPHEPIPHISDFKRFLNRLKSRIDMSNGVDSEGINHGDRFKP
jgi:hypothetical protein